MNHRITTYDIYGNDRATMLSCNDLRCSATFISYNASIQKVERKDLKDV